MEKIYVIYGTMNSGKTHTMWLVLSHLLEAGAKLKDMFHVEKPYKYEEIIGTKTQLPDFRTHVELNGKQIMLLSAGDHLEHYYWGFTEHLKWAEEKNIDIIVCCSRSRKIEGSVYKYLLDNFSTDILPENNWFWLNRQNENSDWLKECDNMAQNITSKILIDITNTDNNKIEHSYEEIVSALKPYIGSEFRTDKPTDNRYILEDASPKRILFTHYYEDTQYPPKKEYLTSSIKQLLQYVNEHGKVNKVDIQKAFYVGTYNVYADIIKAICKKINTIFKVSNGTNWSIKYRDSEKREERFMPSWNELKMNGLVQVKMGIPVVKTETIQSIVDYLSSLNIIKDENGIIISGDELGISEPAYAQLCTDLGLFPWEKHLLPPLAPKVNAFIHSISSKNDIDDRKNNREKPEKKIKKTESNILTTFHISNYKNISKLSLSGLKRLNLFVGANNAGKSNLLEAISLYATNFSPYRMKNILQERNENLDYFEATNVFRENELIAAFAPFFPHRDIDFLANNNYIELSSEAGTIRLEQRIATYRWEEDITRITRLAPYSKITANQRLANNRQIVLVSLPVSEESEAQKAKTNKFERVLHMTKFTNRGIDIQPIGTTNRFKFQYINCKRLTTEGIEDIWAKIAMTDVEQKIVEALQIVDERIERFSFIKNDSKKYSPYVHLKGEANNMPISEMGDGMTHILNIIIALLGCENGILLLDEAESGLHYLTQRQLWKLIFELAEDYNVQVFATTHSNDCIDAFAYNNKNAAGNIIRLEKWGEKMHAQMYIDMSQVLSMRNNDMEIR